VKAAGAHSRLRRFSVGQPPGKAFWLGGRSSTREDGNRGGHGLDFRPPPCGRRFGPTKGAPGSDPRREPPVRPLRSRAYDPSWGLTIEPDLGRARFGAGDQRKGETPGACPFARRGGSTLAWMLCAVGEWKATQPPRHIKGGAIGQTFKVVPF